MVWYTEEGSVLRVSVFLSPFCSHQMLSSPLPTRPSTCYQAEQTCSLPSRFLISYANLCFSGCHKHPVPNFVLIFCSIIDTTYAPDTQVSMLPIVVQSCQLNSSCWMRLHVPVCHWPDEHETRRFRSVSKVEGLNKLTTAMMLMKDAFFLVEILQILRFYACQWFALSLLFVVSLWQVRVRFPFHRSSHWLFQQNN